MIFLCRLKPAFVGVIEDQQNAVSIFDSATTPISFWQSKKILLINSGLYCA